MPNKRIHADKIKLRRFAMQFYFAGDARRWSRRFAPAPAALRITTHLMAVAARRPSSG